MNSIELMEYINLWKNSCWLKKFNFDCDKIILDIALQKFYYDYKRYFPNDEKIDSIKLIESPQLIGILLYRISRELYISEEYSVSHLKDYYSLLSRHIGLFELYYSADIDLGLKINHGIGSVIGARCKIGKNCMIHQNCTLGDRFGGRPQIGNNVIIYAGAMILGNIVIGDNSIIGANSVVLNSCSANSILIGSPAKKSNKNE